VARRTTAAGTDYASYLLIDDLLDLQRPLTPGAHDEMLFIVVHQAYELWFKLLLWELTRARDELLAGRAHAAVAPLSRVHRVEELLLAQLGVLETMSPDGFLQFRDPLAPASGFQSLQFREIEALSGRLDPAHLTSAVLRPEQRERLRAQLAEPALWDGFCACARLAGLDMPEGDSDAAHDARLRALVALFRTHDADATLSTLHQVAEQLVDHDEAIARWRFRHGLMAAREIGARHGTGGSMGVGYLRTTVDNRFFPELWEARTAL
jgi:tryptophan 2,3-dioxygenase